jgi:hypothetical protein
VLVPVPLQPPQQLRLLHLVRQRRVLLQQLLVGPKRVVVQQQQQALLQDSPLQRPATATVGLRLAPFFLKYHFKSIMNPKKYIPTQLQWQ